MIVGPLIAGLLAGRLGLETTLVIFTAVVGGCALLFVVLARETLRRARALDAERVGSSS